MWPHWFLVRVHKGSKFCHSLLKNSVILIKNAIKTTLPWLNISVVYGKKLEKFWNHMHIRYKHSLIWKSVRGGVMECWNFINKNNETFTQAMTRFEPELRFQYHKKKPSLSIKVRDIDFCYESHHFNHYSCWKFWRSNFEPGHEFNS